MRYVLACMPSVFQCLIYDVLYDFLGKFVIAHIDDILIFSPSGESHVLHESQVPEKLRQNNHLYEKEEKWEFHVNTVAFLGSIISADGIAMNEDKVKAVREWPVPPSIKVLQRFVGFANCYRRFIRDFSLIVAPMTTLLKGKTKRLMWNSATDKAFQQQKQAFTSARILRPRPRETIHNRSGCVGHWDGSSFIPVVRGETENVPNGFLFQEIDSCRTELRCCESWAVSCQTYTRGTG